MKLTILQAMLLVAGIAVILWIASFFRPAPPLPERTVHGPFTDRLAPGQVVTFRKAAKAKICDIDEIRRNDVVWVGRIRHDDITVLSVGQGTIGKVIFDPARDVDYCWEARGIVVQIVDGPHMGRVVHIERAYLRRKD